jgi:hypothetical protein
MKGSSPAIFWTADADLAAVGCVRRKADRNYPCRVGAVLAACDMTAERYPTAALDRRHHLYLVEADMAGIGFTPTANLRDSSHASDKIAHVGKATPSHHQIVRHGGNASAPRMVQNDTEMVS